MINPHSNPMNPCPQFEALILESIDAHLSAADQPLLDSHLGGCAACRAFQHEQRRLDELLSMSFQHPALPADFKATMLAQVALLETASVKAGQPATVHDSAMLEQPRPTIHWGESILPALDWVGYAALVIAGIGMVLELSSTVRLPWPEVTSEAFQIRMALATAAASVAAGLWLAFRSKLRVLEWI